VAAGGSEPPATLIAPQVTKGYFISEGLCNDITGRSVDFGTPAAGPNPSRPFAWKQQSAPKAVRRADVTRLESQPADSPNYLIKLANLNTFFAMTI
jgi:hypothetical protein